MKAAVALAFPRLGPPPKFCFARKVIMCETLHFKPPVLSPGWMNRTLDDCKEVSHLKVPTYVAPPACIYIWISAYNAQYIWTNLANALPRYATVRFEEL